jgi:hypothetical protein
MGDNPSDNMLLIIHIVNDERLIAGETEDFLLIPTAHYARAVKVIRDMKKHKPITDITSITFVKNALTAAKIDYEHIIDGSRLYLGDEQEREEE